MTGRTWSIRSTVLFALAMIVLGSETATAGQPTLHEPSATGEAPNQALLSVPKPSPEPQPTDDARFNQSPTASRSPIGTPELVIEPASERATETDSTAALTDPIKAVDVPPTETGVIAPLARPVVVLYGDSLAWEARHVFEQALADQPVQVIIRTFGGTAICDWHDEMAEDAASLQPGLVIIEFVGNNYTPCMQDSAGAPLVGAALVNRYAADAATAVATFSGINAQVVFAGAPIAEPSTASLDLHRAPLNAVYRELGERLNGVRYVDAGSSVLDDGEWTATLACLPLEPCPDTNLDSGAAVNSVRAPDGLHFCPASSEADRGVTGDCPVWSSGAFRYGTALAEPVLESFAAMPRSDGA